MNRSVVSSPGRSKASSYPIRSASGAADGTTGPGVSLSESWGRRDGDGGGNNWLCTPNRSAEPGTSFREKTRSDKTRPWHLLREGRTTFRRQNLPRTRGQVL